MEAETHALLNNLTNKENIKLVSRGNKAILFALRICRMLGKKKVLIQDQGGWITYRQYPQKMKFETIELRTEYGLILIDELKKNIDKSSVLLINSLTGYFAEQDMSTIYNICAQKQCLVINDISGSIGTENAKIGDILVCSFGLDKPLNYGEGGLIAVSNKEWFSLTQILEEDFGAQFRKKLLDLEKRISYLKDVNKKIKNELKEFEIIHKDKNGINVVVKIKNDLQRQQIIKYCEENKYEYTECPRYIRVNCDAISIEVKRLQ